MNILKVLNTSDALDLLTGNYMEVISKYLMVVAIPVLVIALINCFFGHKVFKILAGIAGIIIGAGLGAGICIGINMLTVKDMPSISMIGISTLIGALILGFALFKLYKAGAFCMGFITGVTLGIVIMKLINKDEFVIAGVIGGLLMGLLAIDLYKHMVIILTSVNGGLVGSACIAIITQNDDPVFILKMGVGLAIAGIVFQYIISLLDKNKKDDDEDEEDEDDVIEAKEKKIDKRVAQAKWRKTGKKHAKIEKKKADKKENKIAEKKADKKADKIAEKKATKKKMDNNLSGIFLVDIISNIAQSIKDKIMDIFEDYDEDEDEELEEDEDLEDEDIEDEDLEDEDLEDEELEDKDLKNKAFENRVLKNKAFENRVLKNNDLVNEELNQKISKENLYKYIKEDQYDAEAVQDEVKKYIRKEPSLNRISDSILSQDTIVIKDTDKISDSFRDVEKALERNLEENINIPIFDFDEIGRNLEAELNNNIRTENNEELEDLIVKETIRNLDN